MSRSGADRHSDDAAAGERDGVPGVPGAPGEAGGAAADDGDRESAAPSPLPARAPWYRARPLLAVSWAATAAFAAYALIRSLGLESGWALVAIIAFAPYVAAAAIVGAGLQAGLRHWSAAAVTGAAALAMAVAVLPRAIADEPPPASGAELTVMSVNLYAGRADLAHVVDLVERYEPDLLSVQELQPEAYEELTALGIDRLLPHVLAEPADMAVGTALYSRHGLERLPDLEPEGIFHQIAAEVELPGGERVNAMAVHAAAPVSPERMSQWEADFEDFPEPGDVPWILAGDFNATLDHRNLRAVVDSGFTDAADADGLGLMPTWRPVDGPLGGLLRPPAVTLDHVLVDDRIAVADVAVLEPNGGDHAPIAVTVRLPG